VMSKLRHSVLYSRAYFEFLLMREAKDADLMLYSAVNDSCSMASNGKLRLNATGQCWHLESLLDAELRESCFPSNWKNYDQNYQPAEFEM
jgi:hypothetical protein